MGNISCIPRKKNRTGMQWIAVNESGRVAVMNQQQGRSHHGYASEAQVEAEGGVVESLSHQHRRCLLLEGKVDVAMLAQMVMREEMIWDDVLIRIQEA